MTGSTLRRGLPSALAIALVACGAGDRSSPSAPTAAQPSRAPEALAPATGIALPVTSSGSKPAGFEAAFRVEPKPDTEGIIHGDSPVTVTFDVCHSTPGDDGKPLTYLFDWDFDSLADVVATGDDCVQQHKFKAPLDVEPFRNADLKANVCVVSGNPQVHGPNTYFSCRTFRMRVTAPAPPQQFPCHDICTPGGPLPASCGECEALICAEDDFCCEDGWDGICIDEVASVCGRNDCQDALTAASPSQRRRP